MRRRFSCNLLTSVLLVLVISMMLCSCGVDENNQELKENTTELINEVEDASEATEEQDDEAEAEVEAESEAKVVQDASILMYSDSKDDDWDGVLSNYSEYTENPVGTVHMVHGKKNVKMYSEEDMIFLLHIAAHEESYSLVDRYFLITLEGGVVKDLKLEEIAPEVYTEDAKVGYVLAYDVYTKNNPNEGVVIDVFDVVSEYDRYRKGVSIWSEKDGFVSLHISMEGLEDADFEQIVILDGVPVKGNEVVDYDFSELLPAELYGEAYTVTSVSSGGQWSYQ